jgi:2-phosphosulfolactate phosphatase
VPWKGRFSLSPLTYDGIAPGARVALPSPNGATCVRLGGRHVLVGALVNAAAVARAAALLATESQRCITLLACGERWPRRGPDGALRVAVEDFLGAGAILVELKGEKSPEACVCSAAFHSLRGEIGAVLWECGSGRELRMRGYDEDVRHAARLNRYDVAPVLHEGWLGPFASS